MTNNIGQKIKSLREKRNYTQEYMAEQLGITQSSYSKLEQDKSDLPVSRLFKIAEILEVNTEEYLTLLGIQAEYVVTNNNYKNQQNSFVAAIMHQHHTANETVLYEQTIQSLQKTIDTQDRLIQHQQKTIEHYEKQQDIAPL